LIVGDIRDGDRLTDVMRELRPAAVTHFAALTLVGEWVAEPVRYYDVNVGGGVRLLEAMLACDVDKLVFSSTCAVYGESDEVPIGQSTAVRPVNPYGASKLAFERLLADCDAAYGLRSVRLRYLNAAGADADSEIGEWHENESLPKWGRGAPAIRPAWSPTGAGQPPFSDGRPAGATLA
jgi:UDP-glucose 4-epimerase